MPYKVQDNQVFTKKSGKWELKRTCKNHASAVEAMRLLYAIEKNPNFKAKG
jgi:hypothetical protein